MFILAQASAPWTTQLFFGSVLFIIAVFLVLLVLVQRGRGGGLTGALGGMGGQSAFGAKAGDLFTRITMVTATVWILFSMLAIKMLQVPDPLGTDVSGTSVLAPESTGGTAEDESNITPPTTTSGEGKDSTSGKSGAATSGKATDLPAESDK
jgi:preprotein translocase subunit SecG